MYWWALIRWKELLIHYCLHGNIKQLLLLEHLFHPFDLFLFHTMYILLPNPAMNYFLIPSPEHKCYIWVCDVSGIVKWQQLGLFCHRRPKISLIANQIGCCIIQVWWNFCVFLAHGHWVIASKYAVVSTNSIIYTVLYWFRDYLKALKSLQSAF